MRHKSENICGEEYGLWAKQSGRRRPCGPRPPTPPYVRFRIRRFLTSHGWFNLNARFPVCAQLYLADSVRYFQFQALLRGICKGQSENQYNSTCQVRPFTKRSTQLIWLRLTSDGHLRHLSTTLVPKPRQTDRPPRVMRVTFTLMPAAFTSAPSVQVQGFEGRRLLTQCDRLLCDFCSSGQRFACGFLQIPPRDGHPCRPANRSPCRAGRGLAPPSRPINHHS